MNHTRTVIPVIYVIFLAFLPGCNSSKENSPAPPAQKISGQTQISSAHVPVVAPPQDEAEAAKARDHVLSQVKKGDFAAIYKEASAGFQKVGAEEQFIALWNKQLQETGAFKDAKETDHTVRPSDKFIVFTYIVQYEKLKKELRMTFGRSKKGAMELTGINQREVK